METENLDAALDTIASLRDETERLRTELSEVIIERDESDSCRRRVEDEVKQLRIELFEVTIERRREGGQVSSWQKMFDEVVNSKKEVVAEVEQLRERLQIDPGGSDRIDELEQAQQFTKHALHVAEAKIEWLRQEREEAVAEVKRLLGILDCTIRERDKLLPRANAYREAARRLKSRCASLYSEIRAIGDAVIAGELDNLFVLGDTKSSVLCPVCCCRAGYNHDCGRCSQPSEGGIDPLTDAKYGRC